MTAPPAQRPPSYAIQQQSNAPVATKPATKPPGILKVDAQRPHLGKGSPSSVSCTHRCNCKYYTQDNVVPPDFFSAFVRLFSALGLD